MRDAELHLVEQQWLTHGGFEQFDLSRRLVRHAEVPHLARCMQRVERLGDILGLNQRIRPMQQQNIEIIGAQRPERALYRLDDMLGRKVEIAGPDARLALDHDAAAIGRRQLHRLAEARLAHMRGAAIDVGMVDHGHAARHRRIEQRPDVGIAHLADAHQAQNDARYGEIGMRDFDGLHGFNRDMWMSPRPLAQASVTCANFLPRLASGPVRRGRHICKTHSEPRAMMGMWARCSPGLPPSSSRSTASRPISSCGRAMVVRPGRR